MSLNKSKGQMYKFITHTWNPLGGDCSHACKYCSTNKFHWTVVKEKYSGPLRLYENYLNDNLGKDRFIFVCSQHDLFAENVPDEWINKILEHCFKFDSNKYFIQTRNTKRLERFSLPLNFVICTTIESNRSYPELTANSPSVYERSDWLNEIAHAGNETYVTIEPILDFDMQEMLLLIETCLPKQINIGADSGDNNLLEPSTVKIMELIEQLRSVTKVEIKDNLKRLMK